MISIVPSCQDVRSILDDANGERRMYCKTFLLLAFVVIAPWARAQGVQVGPNGVRLVGFGDVDIEATVDRWAEIERERISTILDLRVELLVQECELTNPQVKKLRV